MDRTGFARKVQEYPEILARYTWENTAELALGALDKPAAATTQTKKVKLAVLAPTPSGYSAIGKLIMQLHPAMQEYFDIDYYVEDGKTQQGFTRPNYLPYIANVRSAQDFDRKAYKRYDAVLYHIGNSEFHMDTIKSSLYLPGYAILHDTHLALVFEGALLSYGYLHEDRLEAERLLDKKINNPKTSYTSSIINNQQALIAHSHYTQEALNDTKLEKALKTIKLNLPTATPQQPVAKKTNPQITIGLAGIIHPAKGLDIVEGLAQMEDFYDCKIHIFGLSLVTEEVISRLQAYPNVQVDTNVTDFQFQNMLSQVDVLMNFRTKYRGETSLATIEAMRFGVVPIVKKTGWYDELPDDAVIKVSNSNELATKLKALINDQARLSAMKKAGKEYIAHSHTYQAYAQNLHKFITTPHTKTSKVDKVAEALKGNASLHAIKQLLAGDD
jgi:glycosyltransferase involved in cell wall biosynthesis